MNKLETAYRDYLVCQQLAGEVAWFAYEGIKLRLAGKTFYTPDFFVMLANGELELHETKGFMQDDAAVKLKVAAENFPFRVYLVKAIAKKVGGGWDITEIG